MRYKLLNGILIVFLLFSSNITIAQSALDIETSNFIKYWKVRGRLIGDETDRNIEHAGSTTNLHNGFLVVGPDKGMSMPSNWRSELPAFTYPNNPSENEGSLNGAVYAIGGQCGNQPVNSYTNGTWNNEDSRDGGAKKRGILEWGDGTSQLARYLLALAYEWKLLRRSGMSTTETEKEIYYGLYATQRLDWNGESSSFFMNDEYNGYFGRDDVPFDFALNHMSKKYDLVMSNYSCIDKYNNGNPSNAYRSTEESYDQLLELVLAFAVLNEMLDNNTSYNSNNLKAIIRERTDKMIGYARYSNGNPLWILRNPYNHQHVKAGYEGGIVYAYALAKAGQIILNDPTKFVDGHSVFGGLSWLIYRELKKAYHVGKSALRVQASAGGDTYDFYLKLAGPATDNANDNAHMTLQAGIASKTLGIVSLTPPITDLTGKKLIKKISFGFRKEIYDLYGSLLSGYTPNTDYQWWRGELSKLPCNCGCVQESLNAFDTKGCPNLTLVYTKNNPNRATGSLFPWITNNRWEHWAQNDNLDPLTADINVNNNIRRKELPSIDYMEAYNAYRYHFMNSGYSQQIWREHSGTIPLLMPSIPALGTPGYPFVVKGVFGVETNSKILSATNSPSGQNGKVEFVAGSYLVFKPGYEAQKGSVVTTRFGDYDCNFNSWWFPNNIQATQYKGTDGTNWIDVDTTITVLTPADSVVTDDTTDTYDTSKYHIEYSGDTVTVSLDPCWEYDDSNNLVYICDSSQYKSNAIIHNLQVNRTLNRLVLYPNPTTEICYIEYELYDENTVEIAVTNTLGQDVSYVIDKYDRVQMPGSHRLRLNMASLAKGMYYCKIKINGSEKLKKVTVY